MKCTAQDCTNELLTVGLCRKHYQTAYRIRKGETATTNDPAISNAITPRFTKTCHCGRTSRAQGLCATHYAQKMRAKRKNPIAQPTN